MSFTFLTLNVHRIEAQKASARELRLSSTLDPNFQINTTNLYKLLAAGRSNVTANVYGADCKKVGLSSYTSKSYSPLIFL